MSNMRLPQSVPPSGSVYEYGTGSSMHTCGHICVTQGCLDSKWFPSTWSICALFRERWVFHRSGICKPITSGNWLKVISARLVWFLQTLSYAEKGLVSIVCPCTRFSVSLSVYQHSIPPLHLGRINGEGAVCYSARTEIILLAWSGLTWLKPNLLLCNRAFSPHKIFLV